MLASPDSAYSDQELNALFDKLVQDENVLDIELGIKWWNNSQSNPIKKSIALLLLEDCKNSKLLLNLGVKTAKHFSNALDQQSAQKWLDWCKLFKPSANLAYNLVQMRIMVFQGKSSNLAQRILQDYLTANSSINLKDIAKIHSKCLEIADYYGDLKNYNDVASWYHLLLQIYDNNTLYFNNKEILQFKKIVLMHLMNTMIELKQLDQGDKVLNALESASQTI